MEKNEKIEAVVKLVQEEMGDNYSVKYLCENNGVMEDAILVRHKYIGRNHSSSIRFDIEDDIYDIAEQVRIMYKYVLVPNERVESEISLDKVIVVLRNSKFNDITKYSVKVADDLFLRFREVVELDNGPMGTCDLDDSIVEQLLEQTSLSFNELVEKALFNTSQIFKLECWCDTNKKLDLDRDTQEFLNFHVLNLTNYSRHSGATSLFYPGVIKKLHERIGNFYIIPDSINGITILKESRIPILLLQQFVFALSFSNRNIDPPKLLGEHPYFYDGSSIISINNESVILNLLKK